MSKSLESPVHFPCGKSMSNRFMLAPMTNCQSHEDGTLSDDEFHWLTMRAKGGFGMVMTCASHVQFAGKGFPGQLGIYRDEHIEGHRRLAAAIKAEGSLAVIQLHHAGMRSPEKLISEQPHCPSAIEKYNSRALSLAEVHKLRDDFIRAAVRSKEAGYDGVEVHGAHGYILTQFLSKETNKREDEYGGSLENRSRILFEIVNGIREQCGDDFLLGVRLSPERFKLEIPEIQEVCRGLISGQKIDFLDISVWDYTKMPEEESMQDKSLMDHFTGLDYGRVRLTVAGKIRSGADTLKVLESEVDFVAIGRSAILHHNFPKLVIADHDFEPVPTPIPEAHLVKEGLGPKFVEYMKRWPDFVA